MNFSALKSRVLQKLNESVSAPQFWSIDNIGSFLNEGYEDLILTTKILESSATLSTVADTFIYSLADNCLEIIRMYYETTDRIIRPMSWEQLQAIDRWWVDTANTYPRYHIPLSSQNVFLYPNVSDSESSCITYWFKAIAQEMSADEDVPDTRDTFHDALVDFATFMALLRERTKSSGKKALKFYAAYQEKKASLSQTISNQSNRTHQLGAWI